MGSLILGALLVASGCRGEPPDPTSRADQAHRPSAPASVPGDLVLVGGELAFLPCDAEETRRLDDGTGSEARRLIDDLGYGTEQVRSAVVIEGGRLVEVRHATPSDARCADLLPEADVEARGNEPFWALRVDAGEARWITPEELEGMVFESGVWTEGPPGAFRYEARHEGVGSVVLVLRPDPCFDTMAGARFPFTAEVEMGGESFTGCALEGTRLASGS